MFCTAVTAKHDTQKYTLVDNHYYRWCLYKHIKYFYFLYNVIYWNTLSVMIKSLKTKLMYRASPKV